MSGAGAATTRSALRRALEDTIAECVRATQTGYTVGPTTYGAAVEVVLDKGDARFVLWLRPASDPSSSYRSTTLFKIGYREPPPDRSGFTLLDAAHLHLQRWEATLPSGAAGYLFEAGASGSPNLELLAVRVGLKPACRLVVPPGAVAKLTEDLRAEGLHASVTEAAAFVTRFCDGIKPGETTVMHVARSERDARRTAELERSMMQGWRRWLRMTATERAFGQALGYPSCCTEAYLRVRTLPNDTIRFHALARTPATASALLNDVDDSHAVISHFPCRYDCAPSLQYAEALLAELGRRNPQAGDARRLALRGLVIRFRDGGALRLELSAADEAPRYRFVAVQAFGSGPRAEAWDTALRGGDTLEVGNGSIRALQGDREHTRLPAPAADVQIRLFE